MTLALMALAVVVLIVLSGFFSGSETALTAVVAREDAHAGEGQGDARARLVSSLIEHKERLIGALLLSNNLVNILASALATALFIDLFGPRRGLRDDRDDGRGGHLRGGATEVLGDLGPDRFALAVAPW